MRAIVQQHYGDSSTLTFEDAGGPRCSDGDVLVQVRAAGVDRGALHFMTEQP
jgi:NADPH:quinone reductase-like Zn-dependent oxidoreductase